LSDLFETYDVVAVAPHPDDLELTCGGTLALLVSQGYRVAMIDLTSGEPTPRGNEEIRRQEAEAARKILGVQKRINIELPNRVLMDSPEGRFKLATELRRLRPSILITIAGRTPAASPDHHQAHLLTEGARFYSQLTKWDDRFDNTEPYRIPHLVYAPLPFDAEQRQWHSTFVIDISTTFAKKLDSVRSYASQFDQGRFEQVEQFLTAQAVLHGSRTAVRYGEFFALPQPLPGRDLVQLLTGGALSESKPGSSHLPMG
jgi:bacillithiol biosynthesis deacetylase BshB1